MPAQLRSFLRRFSSPWGPQLVSQLGTLLLAVCTALLMVLFWHGGKLDIQINPCTRAAQMFSVQINPQALQARLTIHLVRL